MEVLVSGGLGWEVGSAADIGLGRGEGGWGCRSGM